MAKVLRDFSKSVEFLKIKAGYLESNLISKEEVQALAELPPLPVIQAQLLSTIMAPASNLARMLAEPARQVASVIKSFSETEASPAES
jgi:large subunit ribosomal protein L10